MRDTGRMAQRHLHPRRRFKPAATRRRRREKEPSFASQLIIGCLAVSAITWFATPRINAVQLTATSTPEENARREASVYYRGCDDARAAGAAPIHQGQPGYRPEMDGDHDGIACEPYRGY